MALSGEIASLFVRLRPDLRGFASAATAGVKGALTDVQAEVSKAAASSAAAAGGQVDANQAVVASYERVKGAVAGEVDAFAAVKAGASEAQAAVTAGARAGVAEASFQAEANRAVAASYKGVGTAVSAQTLRLAGVKTAAAEVRAEVASTGASFSTIGDAVAVAASEAKVALAGIGPAAVPGISTIKTVIQTVPAAAAAAATQAGVALRGIGTATIPSINQARSALAGLGADAVVAAAEGTSAFTGMEAEIAAAARANVAQAAVQMDANRALAGSYRQIAESAVAGSDEQRAAAQLAGQAAAAAGDVAALSAKEVVAAQVRGVEANRALAASYKEVAATAVAGSDEARVAAKLAADASAAASGAIVATSQSVVAATLEEMAANRNLAATYAEIAAAAAAGSEEARVAAQLSAQAAVAAGDTSVAAAQAVVDATVGELAANRELAASYAQVAASSVRGSEQQQVAAGLAAKANAAAAESASLGARKAGNEVGFLRRHLLNLGSALGIGFGAAIGVKLVKDVTEGAASVQKSAEVIKASFGKSASEVIVKFGDTVASKLGISAQLADATSARFGILFKNIGIGPERAAGMTVGLEKLAGALSAIKGVDPSRALSQITLAMLGNTRSLKQLGVAVDPATEKLAALKLGLISSTKDAFTPAIRAQAIYALATANLGSFQAQAARHAGDYANVQRRLSAEWANAKDVIGTALLPMFVRYSKELADWLTHMIRSGQLQRDFNVIAKRTAEIVGDVAHAVKTGWKIFETAAGWVGGTKRAVEILIGVLAVSKLAGVGKAFIGIGSAIAGIGKAARVAAVVFGISSAAIDAEAVATSAVIKSALISTGIGALVVAAGVAAALVVTHFSTVKRWLAEFGHWIESHAKALFFIPIIGPIILLTVEAVRHFSKIKAAVLDVAHFFGKLVGPARVAFDAIKGTVEAFIHFFETVFTHPIRAVENLFRELRTVVVGVFHGLEADAIKTALAIVEPFTHLPGFLGGGKFRSIKDWLNEQLAGLDGAAQKSASATATLFGKTLTDGLTKKAKSPFGTPNANIDTTAADAAIKNGTAFGKKIIQGVHDVVKAGTPAISKAMADATAQAVEAAQQRIRASVDAAKKNLGSIGQALATSVNKILDKMSGVGGALAGSPQAAAFKKLRDLIAGGGGTPEIERASQQLASELQAKASSAGGGAVSTRRDLVKRQFADLVDEFNKGSLDLAGFNKRVAALLASHHVNYRNAGKLLGVAFADAFKAQVKGIHEQAAAIAALPARLRQTGGAGGAADIKIIRPLEVMRQENQKIAVRAERQRERQIKAAERAAKAAEKTAATLAAANKTKTGPLPGHATKHATRAAAAGVRG